MDLLYNGRDDSYFSLVAISLLALENCRHTHTSTNAHGGASDLGALALHLGEQSGDLASTSGTQGMTHSDGTSEGVDLVDVQVKVLNAHDGLGSESLVELEDIDILDLDAGLLASSGNSVSRADTHDARRAANDGGGDVLAGDGETETLSSLALHQEDSGGTVRDLGGVTAGGGTTESGLKLGKGLGSGALTDTLILGDNDLLLVTLLVLDHGLNGNDLAVELALLLGLGSLLVRKCSESILLLAVNVVLGGNVLGGHTHREVAVLGSLAGSGDLLGDVGSHGGRTVSHSHGLNTGTNTDVDQTGLNVGGNADDGLKTGGALTVGGVDGGGLGVSGVESSHAGDGGTTGSLEDVTNADIVNQLGVDASALLDGDKDSSQKILTRCGD